MKNNIDKSFTENLRDTKHNAKAKEILLKLLAKQKVKANPFDKVRSQTWNPDDKSNPKNELEI